MKKGKNEITEVIELLNQETLQQKSRLRNKPLDSLSRKIPQTILKMKKREP